MDLMKMMKNARGMQERMQEMQADIETILVEGSAGGGMVTVGLTGRGTMTSLKIDPSLLSSEEAEVLEDLIIAAHSDARAKAEAEMARKTQDMMASMGLPADMKLPF